jgi:hypothetical protein
MKFKHALIVTALLLSATSAQAELVETDWKNTGDALATLDTETGIEWLDLTQTDYMSINQAEGLTGEGGAFDGWRLPTRDEVTQMMVNAFPSIASQMNPGGSGLVTSATTQNEADIFSALFGQTDTDSWNNYSYGMLKNDPGQDFSVIYSGALDVKSTTNKVNIRSNVNLRNDYNYKNATHGVFLVSDGGTTQSSLLDPSLNINNTNAPVNINDVSAPALLSLMSLGLFGFAARRRSSTTNLNK